LRGVAILLVFGRHIDSCPPDEPYPLYLALGLWQRCGWIGVDLFFVLSGFLVSGLLFREYKRHGNIRLGRFLIRRGLKIYPAFYLFLAILCTVRLALGEHVPLGSVLAAIFFVQNYVPNLQGIWSHTWSLAVEEHFYLGIGVFFLILLRRRTEDRFRILLPCYFGVATIVLAWRIITAMNWPFGPMTHLFPTHLRMDSLFLGVLLAYFYHLKPAHLAWVQKHRAFLLGVCVLFIMPNCLLRVETFFVHTVGLTLLAFGFGGMLLTALTLPIPTRRIPALGLSFLAVVGGHSYSIYLWHLPCKFWMKPLCRGLLGHPIPYVGELAVYCIASIVIGILMARIIEFPVLKLRDRIFPSRGLVASLKMALAGAGRMPTPAMIAVRD